MPGGHRKARKMGKTAGGEVTAKLSLSPYEQLVRTLSERLVEAQRPIRILDAVQWDDSIEHAFFAGQARKLPPVTRDYYLSRPLRFDPEQKDLEFRLIERDIGRQLGALDGAGMLMARRCAEYRDVVRMLSRRGTRAFVNLSEQLYGRAGDRFRVGGPTLADFGKVLAGLLGDADVDTTQAGEPRHDASAAVKLLGQRLGAYFGDAAAVRVKLSDGIVADAAAGGDYVKLRRDAHFSARDLSVLEVHEGWVHLGTTLNGQGQPLCTFLGKGPPSSTIAQEGLAVLTELLAGVSHPRRLRRLAQRIAAIARAEAGGHFLDVYRYLLNEGCTPRESYQQSMRIFRGSLPEGCGPFTKDLSYGRGLILVCDFIRAALRDDRVGAGRAGTRCDRRHPHPNPSPTVPPSRGREPLPNRSLPPCGGGLGWGVGRMTPERRIALLFCGKTSLSEMALLEEMADQGLVLPPRFLPPPFADCEQLRTQMTSAAFCGPLSFAA